MSKELTPEERRKLQRNMKRRASRQARRDAADLAKILPFGGTEHDAADVRAQADPRVRKRIRVTGRTAAFINGDIKVEDLTPEELVRGQLKGVDGKWHKPPKMVPREFHQACMRELLGRGDALFRENYLIAIRALADIAGNAQMDAGDRIRASNLIIERVAGKVPDKIELPRAAEWQDAMAEIVATEEEAKAMKRAHDKLDA